MPPSPLAVHLLAAAELGLDVDLVECRTRLGLSADAIVAALLVKPVLRPIIVRTPSGRRLELVDAAEFNRRIRIVSTIVTPHLAPERLDYEVALLRGAPALPPIVQGSES